ncbi:hypothetical protein BT93_L0235 [Corymbia citriodora subsp. variegata]|uniref:Uncharacterized protein n=1 Tax=Corymbia citriodora subsp. variegata TaxID=360336 RepID=A0A8T0CRL0_CORYI|nr:hypothetical protein BT93_L0235 [Corymbia citriodora subsp. variegata]
MSILAFLLIIVPAKPKKMHRAVAFETCGLAGEFVYVFTAFLDSIFARNYNKQKIDEKRKKRTLGRDMQPSM